MKHGIRSVLFSLLLPLVLTGQGLEQSITLRPALQQMTILEFTSPVPSDLGPALSFFMGRQILRAVRSTNGISIVPLGGTGDYLDDDLIERIADDHHAEFIVWGEFYDSDGSVVVQTHVRVFNRAPLSEVDLGLDYRTPEGTMEARLPSYQINFTPVELSPGSIAMLRAAFVTRQPLRQNTGMEALVTDTLIFQQENTILSIQQNWLRIETAKKAFGWLAPTPALDDNIFRHAGEFIAGVSFFLAGDYAASQQQFKQFLQSATEEEDVTLALAHLLAGSSELRAHDMSMGLPDEETVTQEYKSAVTLLPDSPSPVDFLAIARLLKYSDSQQTYRQGSNPELSEVEDLFIATVKSEGQPRSVENLNIFYKLARKYGWLKPVGMTDVAYTRAVNDRLAIIDTIKQEEAGIITKTKVEIVIREEKMKHDYLSMRFGTWFPEDVNLRFRRFEESATDSSVAASMKQSQAIGLDFHYRTRLVSPLYFDFSIGGWFSSYELNYSQPVGIFDSTIDKLQNWSVVVPITIGLSVSLLPGGPVLPSVMVGAGGSVGISNLNALVNGKSRHRETDTKGTFGWFFGAGLDIYLSDNFAISGALKYQNIKFEEALLTGQKNFTGLQVSIGFTSEL